METRFSVCPHDCPDTCGWHVQLEQGVIKKITGDPGNLVTKGVVCDKVRYYLDRVYGPQRILYPMKRVGPKGTGKFQRISWDQALTEITDRWKDLIENHGSESILPFSYAGTEGVVNKASMDRRFFNRIGSTQLERTICSSAGSAGYNLAYGKAIGVNPLDSVYAKLIIFWGINVLETNVHQAILANEARKNGAKIVVIDVHRNRSANWADEFFQIKPGSDGALAMGIAHILFRDSLISPWAKENTLGLEELEQSARNYPPNRVRHLTGLSIDQIEQLAKMYASIKPSLIRIGNGFQHHDNGGMSTWAVSCLPALVGAWEKKGGGAIKFNSGYFPLNKAALERPDLACKPSRIVNMNQLGKVLTELDPPVRSLYVYNSNPAVVVPEQKLVRQGLMREDLFTVVHEQVWTDTVLFADIVLPATTHLEHSDLYISYWHCFLQWADPVIPRQGESKPNIEVFQELANRMGFKDACFKDSTEAIASQALDTDYWRELGIDFENLQKQQVIPIPTPEIPFSHGFFTASGKVELKSNTFTELGSYSVPRHVALVEGPESVTDDYPLTLISPPNHWILNSTLSDVSQILERIGEPVLEINKLEAEKRGIETGDKVEVYNQRGACQLKAILTEAVLPGVVVSTGIWPANAYRDGNTINVLTPSRLADLGNGATFFSNLVQVRRIS